MGQFYVPELGDQITLVSDWTFDLYRESRNNDVWEALSAGVTAPAIAAWGKLDAELEAELKAFERANFHTVQKPTPVWGRRGMGFETELRPVSEPKPGFEEAYQELRDRRWDHHHNSAKAAVTLPAGTVLTVDRIYIRKGGSDYSSISFFVHSTNHPNLTRDKKAKGFKKGRKRFWAKLHDCNTINFEPVKEAA